MRLFIAIEFNDMGEYLTNLQKSIGLGSEVGNVSCFHLTLKFLGKVPKSNLNEIINKLKTIKFNGFSLELDKIGFFPNNNYVRVIWIGVEPKDKVILLQKKIESALSGMFENEFDFYPHVTLARVKSINDRKSFFDSISNLTIEKRSVNVNKIKLIKSTLTPLGPVYEDMEEFSCSAE